MLHIVVNPAGASGRTGAIFRKLEPVFAGSGKEYKVHFSTTERGIREICRDLTAGEKTAGPDGNKSDRYKTDIVVIGGDGTLNEAINGIEDLSKVRIGYIPGGSGNDFGRDLGLQSDPEKTAAVILEGRTVRKTDIGEIICGDVPGGYGRRFNVSAGLGFDAQICEQVENSPLKPVLNRLRLGRLIYILVAVRLIFAHRTMVCHAVYEDGSEEQFDRCMFSAVMNHRYEGGGFQFCPHADASDRMLDICTIDHVGTAKFFAIFPTAYSGQHLKFNGAYERRVKEVHYRTDRPVWVHTDGEPLLQSRDVTVRLLPEQLEFLM